MGAAATLFNKKSKQKTQFKYKKNIQITTKCLTYLPSLTRYLVVVLS